MQADPSGDLVPGCCPQGVTSFFQDEIASSCNTRISDTPYRMFYSGNTTGKTITKISFTIDQPMPVMPTGNSDCVDMDLAVLRLYLDPLAASAVKTVQINKQNHNFAIKYEGQTYLEVQSGMLPSVAAQMDVGLTGVWTGDQVCNFKTSGSSVCSYVLEGKMVAGQYACCNTGDLLMSTVSQPVGFSSY